VKIAKDRGRGMWLFTFVLAALVIGTICQVRAQQSAGQKFQVPPAAPLAKANERYKVNPQESNVPALKPTAIPVNPGDPIAVVNNQIISRQQLADECVARKGKEILELLINRTLIDQALRAEKKEVTGADIDQEIDTVAQRYGISREGWLRTLDKERGISPVQYARDIIYPALALRKLSSNRVQVTGDDLRKAFEAQYGEKLRCRMILVNKQTTAIAIWEELHKNPGGFEKIAQEQSMDSASRSLGGLLAEPITRHAYPQSLSDAAFYQLVDGDPTDRDISHKPTDGAFTGPIQVGEMVWVILRRDSVVPADKTVSLKDPRVAKQTQEMIYEVKLKEAMQEVFKDLLKAASIENQFTGTVKLANEEKDPSYGVDGNVKLMAGQKDDNKGDEPKATAPPNASAVPRSKMPAPAGLYSGAEKQMETLERPLKPRSAPAKPGASGTGTADASAKTAPPSN
jgi:parvulin-like peptidyl-prolyl isomerase